MSVDIIIYVSCLSGIVTVFVPVFAFFSLHECVCVFMCMVVCVCMCVFACTFVCVCLSVCVSVSVCVYVCVSVTITSGFCF